ncbi:uncharacterized protein LOC117305895 isoform X2 [Asterias rubens]|uniref:uncharacterized protein LOC117305895 isoform X2 n=1 Tax=Asterias rubens TaxID=7604 RepID=UPI001454E50F|nr:uncharacterized protein LOC117305895 isoform X2 [Asterias rubens]
MASEIANVVSFFQPLGTSETVCHNIPCSRMIRELPLLPPIPIDCNVTTTTTPMDTTTPSGGMTEVSTTTSPPSDNAVCWWIVLIIAAVGLLLIILLIWKRRSFRGINCLCSSKPRDEVPPDIGLFVEPVELVEPGVIELHARSTDVEPPPHRYEEIGNAAPVQPESELLYETSFGNEGQLRGVHVDHDVELHADHARVEERSTDVETTPNVYEGISNAATVEPEAKLFYESSFGNV